MKNKSIWLDVKSKSLKCVTKDLECDTLIIGGGITGLSTLYQLRKANVDALLVERNKCGEGVTARSTAKITYLQEKIYKNPILKKMINLFIPKPSSKDYRKIWRKSIRGKRNREKD